MLSNCQQLNNASFKSRKLSKFKEILGDSTLYLPNIQLNFTIHVLSHHETQFLSCCFNFFLGGVWSGKKKLLCELSFRH